MHKLCLSSWPSDGEGESPTVCSTATAVPLTKEDIATKGAVIKECETPARFAATRLRSDFAASLFRKLESTEPMPASLQQ